MTARITIGLALLAVSTATASVAWKGLPGGRRATHNTPAENADGEYPIESLVDCLQARFHTLDGFGMSRMAVVPEHVRSFNPQTPEEQASVSQLRDAGLDVAFYLGGRGLLKPRPTKAEWENGGEFGDRRAISMPMFVTDPKGLVDLPHPTELWNEGRNALAGRDGAAAVPAAAVGLS
jgi:hypothetical protein